MGTVDRIWLFRVSPIKGPAQYEGAWEIPLDGSDYLGKVEELAEKDLPRDVYDPGQGAKEIKITQPKDPWDGLAIHFRDEKGKIAVVISLPHPDRMSNLTFVGPFLSEMGSHIVNASKFMTEPRIHAKGHDRWASFVIDLDDLRGSLLAMRIQDVLSKMAEQWEIERHEHEKAVMSIPFSLNIVDGWLGFSPWMMLDDDHDHCHDDSSVHFLTHGGVHPGGGYRATVNLS